MHQTGTEEQGMTEWEEVTNWELCKRLKFNYAKKFTKKNPSHNLKPIKLSGIFYTN